MKRVQVDIPDYVEKMMKEISSATTWKDREIICRAIEKMYIDYVDHERDEYAHVDSSTRTYQEGTLHSLTPKENRRGPRFEISFPSHGA